MRSVLCAEECDGSGEGAGVAVDHPSPPGSLRVTARIHDQEIEPGVVGLPECIWPIGAMLEDHFESVAIPDMLVTAVVAGLSLSAAVQVERQAMGELDLARRADSALPIRGGNHARELPASAPPSTAVSLDSAR